MRTSERRRLTTLLALLLVILGAFTAEAMLKDRTCLSAMTVDQSGTTVYPTVCYP